MAKMGSSRSEGGGVASGITPAHVRKNVTKKYIYIYI